MKTKDLLSKSDLLKEKMERLEDTRRYMDYLTKAQILSISWDLDKGYGNRVRNVPKELSQELKKVLVPHLEARIQQMSAEIRGLKLELGITD